MSENTPPTTDEIRQAIATLYNAGARMARTFGLADPMVQTAVMAINALRWAIGDDVGEFGPFLKLIEEDNAKNQERVQ